MLKHEMKRVQMEAHKRGCDQMQGESFKNFTRTAIFELKMFYILYKEMNQLW